MINPSKLRRRITWEAARLMHERRESDYHQARIKAARRICKGWVKPADLPSDAEIRDELQALTRLHDGQLRTENLRALRIAALRVMRVLERHQPELIGPALSGNVPLGSPIDFQLAPGRVEDVTHVLDEQSILYDVERNRADADHQGASTDVCVRLREQFPFRLRIAPEGSRDQHSTGLDGQPPRGTDRGQLEALLRLEYPGIDLAAELTGHEAAVDRFDCFESLLLPLENVKQSPKRHPEGDALYHSLQVFDLARDELPYDEEFLLAALLHDVGKAIDPLDHVAAGLEALKGLITERTAFLIEFHSSAHEVLDKSIGVRALRRLRESESYDELILLARCDRAGRQVGVPTSETDEALGYIKELADDYG